MARGPRKAGETGVALPAPLDCGCANKNESNTAKPQNSGTKAAGLCAAGSWLKVCLKYRLVNGDQPGALNYFVSLPARGLSLPITKSKEQFFSPSYEP